MRDAFFDELAGLYRDDDRVVFLTGDLGYTLFRPLEQIDPRRVVNFGIREAAMVGFAAGLAALGRLPFVYSIVPFLTLRCLEQIKLDLCYNRLRAVLVGVGGGFAYGPNGPTHHGVDDLGVLSALPGMTCWTPATPKEVRAFVRQTPDLEVPAFLRLGRNGEPDLDLPVGSAGEPVLAARGRDGLIVTCGVLLHEVLAARAQLETEGIVPAVVHLPVMSPFPDEALMAYFSPGQPCLAVEEHVEAGGLGQRLALRLAQRRHSAPFRSLAIPNRFPDACYSRPAALAWAGLDAPSITRHFLELIHA